MFAVELQPTMTTLTFHPFGSYLLIHRTYGYIFIYKPFSPWDIIPTNPALKYIFRMAEMGMR